MIKDNLKNNRNKYHKSHIKHLYIYLIFCFIFTILFLLLGWNTNLWNGINKNEDLSFFNKFFNRFYFVLISMSTMGYGDITPKGKILKLLTMIMSIVVALSILQLIVANDNIDIS